MTTSSTEQQAQVRQENRFARIVGTRFLGFVCAASESEITSRLADGRRLRSEQEAILSAVLTAVGQSALVAFQTGAGEGDFLHPLFEYDEQARTSRANTLRRSAGGALPRISYRNEAERALATLARDVYPALLLDVAHTRARAAPSWIQRLWLMSPLTYRHPARRAFEMAAGLDPEIGSLFTEETPESGKTGFVWTSLGLGRGVQLAMLANDLLGAALFKLLLDDELSHLNYVEEAVAQLQTLRRLLRGEQVDVVCRVAFVGAELPGRPLETPWGTIRKPTAGELQLRSDTPVAHSQELVLATHLPLEVAVDRTPSGTERLVDSPFTEKVEATFTSLQRKADLLALTLLLGVHREPVVAIGRTWTLVENPLKQGPSLSWSQDVVPLHPHVLASEDRRRIRTWMTRIDKHYSDRIDIAVKRTLSSLTTRRDATDRLIDAVVALENLFGTGSGELSFRISAGCAFLLERDAPRRAAVQREVARLYTVRSKIVHGAHAPAPGDLLPDARAASDFAVRAMRELFARRPDLVDERDRARLLILGGSHLQGSSSQ